MNTEHQLLLTSRFPDLLALEPGPLGELGMAFTYRVGAAGWFDLLDKFLREVNAIRKNQGPTGTACRITEIKEKMGDLRIACAGATEQVQNLINEARLDSGRTCQACGNDGTLCILPGNLAATLCEKDRKRLSKPVRRAWILGASTDEYSTRLPKPLRYRSRASSSWLY